MPSDFSDEERLDAEMLAEEITGKVEPKTPEQGIADMLQRVAILTARRNRLYGHPDQDFATDRIVQLDLEIASALARLAEYKTQLQGRN